MTETRGVEQDGPAGAAGATAEIPPSAGPTAPAPQGTPPGAPPGAATGVPTGGDGGTPQRGGAGRVLLVLGVTVAALGAVWGGVHLVDLAISDTQHRQETFAAAGHVELVADGEVTVRAADDATGVEVDVVSRGGLAEPDYSAQEVGTSRLVLTNDCPAWASLLSWTCSGRLHAVVPAGTEVTVRTSNGDVLASGPVGVTDIDTSNGSVQAEDVSGDLEARSSNGDIEVRGVTGDAVVRSSNGDVDASGVTGRLEAGSSNGRIEVADVGGAVVAKTSNGRVEVRDVGGSADARSSNGSVDVAAVAGDVFAKSTNGRVTVVGDGDPVALTIDTTNGDEIIEGPTDPAAARTVEIRSSNGDVAYLAP